jgi:endogenous inhibitor of DNA gyrase (YacG/DUF329 family)
MSHAPNRPLSAAAQAPLIACPQCRASTRYSVSNPYRPFCSARCQSHDLGAWASEQFRLASQQRPDDGGEAQAI